MKKVFDDGSYRKILISRPIVPLGRDIGIFQEQKRKKLSHWMQPIFDNLELLCASQANEPSDTMQWVLENKKIEMEAVTYIRGRLPRMFIIIDEAQNSTPMKWKQSFQGPERAQKLFSVEIRLKSIIPTLIKTQMAWPILLENSKIKPSPPRSIWIKQSVSELAAIAWEIL